MKNKEILAVVDAVAHEKRIEKGRVFEAIEQALATAAKKVCGEEYDIHVIIDRNTGSYQTYRRWEVLSDNEALEFPDSQLYIEDAQEKNADIQTGDLLEEEMEPIEFGRISAQIVKQVIMQVMRVAERDQVANEYAGKLHQLLSGTIKKTTRDNIIIDLGNNAEAIMPRDQILPKEIFRPGDRVRAVLYEIRPDIKGPQLFASRAHPSMLIELFKLEVPEISEELIEIRGAARDPGSRAKIAVKTNDKRIDPVGACVGMRGSRVQAVSSELGGERIDIILWDDNPAQLVINAMAPAEATSIVMDEDSKSMDIAVRDEQLSQAIGRNGQNVRLASQLTGWELNVMTDAQASEKNDTELGKIIATFMADLNVEEDFATLLAEEGFTTLEEVAYVPAQELLAIEGFDQEIVDELRQRARDGLLMKAISDEGAGEPAADLLEMEDMDSELAQTLAKKGIITMEDLAEQSVDDLLEITKLTKDKAASLIMAARAPWFE